MSKDYWVGRWEASDSPWHKTFRYPFLVNHDEKLIAGRSNIKMFFPLCGKAVDMKYYYDAGHTVVGLDVAAQALKDFFVEQNLEYTVEEAENCQATIYKSLDGRLRLYDMDLYDFGVNVEGKFDAIWDKGSLVAINREDREKYRDLMLTLLGPETRYFLVCYDYNESEFTGPPHCVPLATVQELYGDACSIEVIEELDRLDERSRSQGFTRREERLHLITLKK